MKIKVYLVTYKGHKRLKPTLSSLFASDLMNYDYEINIINNHTDIRLPEEFKGKVCVIHNTLRPDWSSGHLSRNWNQAIINGFKSLADPDCDVIVCSQDDSLFKKDWASRLLELHQKYSFVHNGHGDQFHSYTPESVKRVGLWDERFCGISRQAADYFWRCVMYNKEGSTIQDSVHQRVLNPITNNIDEARSWLVDPDVRQIDTVHDNSSHNNDWISQQIMLHKYGKDPFPWTPEKINNAPQKTLCTNYILYPYFEKHIYDLKQKGYLA